MSSRGADGCRNKHPGEDIVDGPQPMKNQKPSEITPNSVDQFWQSHQAEYEAREKRSTGHVERVHRHNLGYPALKDELDRRRSISKVTPFESRMNPRYVCSECLLRRKNYMKKNALKSKYTRNSNRENETKEHGPNRRRGAIYKHKNYRLTSRGCQYAIPAIDLKTDKKSCNILNLRSKIRKRNRTKDCIASDVDDSVNEDISRSDVRSNKHRSTTEFSVSSYNTFPSMDHEPMV